MPNTTLEYGEKIDIWSYKLFDMGLRKKGKHLRRADHSAARKRRKKAKGGKPKNR